MGIAKSDIEDFFGRYERLFNSAVDGADNLGDVKGLYATEFVAATPRGVFTGKVGDDFETVMAQGYERYRAIGTKGMAVQGVDAHDIDDTHCLAKVRWDSVYQQDGAAEVHVPFEVSYLLALQDNELKVFGWISGDEEELLKANGIL